LNDIFLEVENDEKMLRIKGNRWCILTV